MVNPRATDWSDEFQGQMPDSSPVPKPVRGLLFDEDTTVIQFKKNSETNMTGGKYKVYGYDGALERDVSEYDLLTEINHDGADAVIQWDDPGGWPGRLYIVVAETSAGKTSIPTDPVWWLDPNYFCEVRANYADMNLTPRTDVDIRVELVLPSGTDYFHNWISILTDSAEVFQKDADSGEYWVRLLRNTKLPAGSYYNFTARGGNYSQTWLNKKVPNLETEKLVLLEDVS